MKIRSKIKFVSYILVVCMVADLIPVRLYAQESQVLESHESGLESETEMPAADGNSIEPQDDNSIEPQADTSSVYVEDLKIWFEPDSGTVTDADEDIAALNLPAAISGAAVKNIGANAFSGCSALTEIALPEGLESIGDSAFAECTSLVCVIVPDSVKDMGKLVFQHCAALTEVVLSEGLSAMPDQAFLDCSALRAVAIPQGVENIGWYAFSGCKALEEIMLPESIIKIDDGAFQNCISLASVSIPDSVKQMGYIHNPYHTGNSGSYFYCGVFAGCKGLAEVSFGKGVTSIGSNAFNGCTSLERIHLPNSLQEVGSDVFAGCTSLTQAELSSQLDAISYRMFSGCTALKKIEIPDGIKHINFRAFSGCSELTSVVIPDSVVSIGEGYEFVGIDYILGMCGGVFENCPNLSYVTIPESVTEIPVESASGSYQVTHTLNFEDTTVVRVKEGSEAEKYVLEKELNFIYYFDEKSLALNLYDPERRPITDGYAVSWFEHDSDVPIADGRMLSVFDSRNQYDYEITLSESLLWEY